MLDVSKMVDAVLDAIERPLAAFSGRLRGLEEKLEGIKLEKGEPGEKGDPGKDGISVKGDPGLGISEALIDQGGGLALTMSDGTIQRVGLVVGKDGEKGDPGRDGFGFDDLDVLPVDDRTFAISFTRGDETKQFMLKFAVPLYRDVYRAERAYERGDMVTFGGSLWHANQNTDDKPGDGSAAWTLATKRGRDGRSAVK